MAERIDLTIGPTTGAFRLEGAPAAFLPGLRQRLGDFASAHDACAASDFSLQVRFRELLATPPQDDATLRQPRVLATADRIELSRWDFDATLVRPTGGTSFQGNATCNPTLAAFESLLRVLWTVHLPLSGGAFFHACGLRHGGRAILAAGPSGAGKTTLARKAPLEDVLSDEVVAVWRQPGAGATGGWSLSSTPFFGELQHGQRTPRTFLLEGIGFLEQRRHLQITPLSPGEAVVRALECLMSWQTDADSVDRAFSQVVALCSEVPTFLCGNRADTSLDELFAGMSPLLMAPHAGRPDGPPVINGQSS